MKNEGTFIYKRYINFDVIQDVKPLTELIDVKIIILALKVLVDVKISLTLINESTLGLWPRRWLFSKSGGVSRIQPFSKKLANWLDKADLNLLAEDGLKMTKRSRTTRPF